MVPFKRSVSNLQNETKFKSVALFVKECHSSKVDASLSNCRVSFRQDGNCLSLFVFVSICAFCLYLYLNIFVFTRCARFYDILQPETLEKLIFQLLLFFQFFFNFSWLNELIEWANFFFVLDLRSVATLCEKIVVDNSILAFFLKS